MEGDYVRGGEGKAGGSTSLHHHITSNIRDTRKFVATQPGPRTAVWW